MKSIHRHWRRLLGVCALALAGSLPMALAQTPQGEAPASSAGMASGAQPAAAAQASQAAQTSSAAATSTAEAKAGGSFSRNVYSAGGTARPAGPVDGDYVAAGGRVIADQPVKGDALLVGGSIDVRAPVGDDLRAVGGDVNIEGTIGGEVYAAGGNVSLAKSSQVGLGMSVAAGRVSIDGRIAGPLRASGQRIVINGEVGGDARLFGESIELGPTARITGALHHTSRELKRADGAVVGGPLTHDEMKRPRRDRDEDDWQRARETHYDGEPWVGALVGYLGLLATGVVLVLLFPKFAADAPERLLASPWLSLALGFGTLVGLPVLAVLLFITLFGIPLGLAAISVYPLLLLLGYLVGVLFIAQRIRQGFGKSSTTQLRYTFIYMALSLLILLLIAWLPLLGALSVIVTLAAGIGACLLEWHRRRQVPPSAVE
jgi:cytoskeletal protein CcmA (bactofilin family)